MHIKSGNAKICASILILIFTTFVLLHYHIVLHSDVLYIEAFLDDLFAHGIIAWSDWKLPPSPSYIPDIFLYFISYPILPTAFWRIFFVSAAQVFLLTIMTLWLVRILYPKVSKNALACAILIIAFINIMSSKAWVWFYMYSNNTHFGSLLFSLLSLGLFIRFIKNPTWAKALLLVFVGASAAVSTPVFLLCFIIPAFVLALLHLINFGTYLIKIEKNLLSKKILLSILAILSASYLLSRILYRVLTYHNPLKGRAPFTFDRMRHSFELFLTATKAAFSLDNYFTYSFSIIALAALSFLLLKLILNLRTYRSSSHTIKNWPFVLAAVFLMILIPINVGGAILSGGFMDSYAYRYFVFPITLIFILSLIIIDQSQVFLKFPKIYSLLYWSSIIWMLIISLHDAYHAHGKNSGLATAPQVIASCLTDIEKNGFTLKAGIADYWNSRAVSIYLERKNPILSTLNNLEYFFWISSIGPLLHPARYVEYRYNFAILHNLDDSGAFDYTPNTIGKILPPPSLMHPCPQANSQIWLYEGDELNSLLTSLPAKMQ